MRFAAILLRIITITCFVTSLAHAADPSPETLFKRLNALAATGNADVKYNLGMFLNNGIGTAQDNKAAFRYFVEAAESGSELAAYKVGCYYAGQFAGIVATDEDSALKYKLKAAEAGYDLAQLDAGMHFGRKGDVANALLWWERASRQVNAAATAYLAHYFSGNVSPDKTKGLALLLLLKERMPTSTKEMLDRIAALESQLSSEEKLEAKRIRSSWFEGPTPLTAKARSGFAAVPALLASLEK